jgi:diguanylate cyclase (GGDEF)-like protein
MKFVLNKKIQKSHRSIISLYSLLIASMVCAYFIFYFFGIQPLTKYIYSINQDKIKYDLSKASLAFNCIIDRQKQLALQIASRSVIRENQIAYLENKISKKDLVAHSQSKLADALRASEEILGISRYDPNGSFLFSVGQDIPGFIEKSCISNKYPDDINVFFLKEDTGSKFFAYCSRIIDKDFGVVGFDIVLMSDYEIKNMINKEKNNAFVYIIASDKGEVFYRSGVTEEKVEYKLMCSVEEHKKDKKYIVEKNNTTIPSVKMYSIVDRSIFLSPVKRRLFHLALVLIALSSVSLVVSILIARPIFRSMTEEQRMRRLSQVDVLTGLYNRRALVKFFDKEVSRLKRYGRPLSLVIFDIDHFKKFNDTYGHVAGDQVLRRIGDYCLDFSRKNDIWIRYGGEEFLAILPETDDRAVVSYADRFRVGIENLKIKTCKGPLSVTISGGYHSFSSFGPDVEIDSVVNMIDKALYEAKKTGRNKMTPYG